MPYYCQCPTCGNRKENDKVYVCKMCHHIFCSFCQEVECVGFLGLFEIPRCPICQSTEVREIGSIYDNSK